MKTINVRKLTYETIESPDGTDGYEAPKGWRSITLEEFTLSHFNNQMPTFIESRQFNWDNDKQPYGKIRVHATLYWYPDKTGVAFHKEWVFDTKTRRGNWEMRFFAFGCKHQFKELSPEDSRARGVEHYGNCWHVHECQLCHRTESYDSSD